MSFAHHFLYKMVSLNAVAMPLAATILMILLLPHKAFSAKAPGRDAILLSNVQTLTLRANRMTTSRRVPPISQLTCVGPSKKICNLYTPEIMRCKNEGSEYDGEDVQWTCTAPMPSDFKLGATDVICEGYRNSDDDWVLKGSCGVEYRLLLTEEGEERFGNINSATDKVAASIFWIIFIAIFIYIMSACMCGPDHAGGRNRRGRGGGGGGGGGYPPGPPPPYSRFADDGYSSYKRNTSGSSWRPGFWSGALGGAAAGYGLGRSTGNERVTRNSDPGEGSSRNRSSQFSSTSESTGFGSTRRR